ncbi:RHS repeat domain-containing protein [Flavobacterium anhuiense]|uniref:RHS repeat domain-containing protein n=1 Tax=Flavobacterium anhuiense TaxID=459526 RepID=UPI0034D97443
MNRFIIGKLFHCFLFFVSFYSTAQNSSSVVLPQIVPPAPNAAALAQYADIPVSKYNGVPNISIPLYTIKTGGYELPITVSYHASGIRVAQEASNVGLGWVLNTGGVITRQVRGIDDFNFLNSNRGFLASPALPAYGDYSGLPPRRSECNNFEPFLASTVLTPFINFRCTGPKMSGDGLTIIEGGELLADYIADTESDLYSFNFGPYSGKFVVNKDGSTVLYSPESCIIIKVINTNSWQATTPDGVIYKFTKKEYTRPYSFTTDQYYPGLELVTGGNSSYDYISSWYLTDILLTNGENITFSYTDLNTESWNYGSIITNRVEQIGSVNCTWDNEKFTSYNNQYTKSSSMNTIECMLHTISWNEGSVNFSYSDRVDLSTQVSLASKKIDKISIKKLDGTLPFNTDGTEISKIEFSQSYFNSQDLNSPYKFLSLRLKLDSFTVDDKKYSFTYLNPNALPKKTSNSTDHWGYFNNEPNLSDIVKSSGGSTYNVPYFIPKMMVTDLVNFQSQKFYNGANRNCNPAVITNGMLASIQYPTKGVVSFEYEPNEFDLPVNSNTSYALVDYADAYDDSAYTIENKAVASVCAGCYVPATNPSFTLTKKTKVKFQFSYAPYGSQTNSVPVDGNGNGLFFGSIVRTDVAIYSKSYYFVPGSLGKVFNDEIELEAGTYKISIGTNYNFTTKASANYSSEKSLPASKRIVGGGVRIKKIISDKNTKVFTYNQEMDPTKTSGILMTEPSYAYVSFDMFNCFRAFVKESSPVHPLSDSGAAVGYTWVKENITDGFDVSSTLSKYKNRAEFRNRGSNTPVMPVFDNGLLWEETYLNNSRVVSKKTLNYENALVKRYELYNTYFIRVNFTFGTYANSNYYRIMPEWWKLTSETTQDYFYDSIGTQSIVSKQTIYDYNINNFKVNKITTLNSEGKSVVQKITYPYDYTSSIYTGMVNKNFINTPIETIVLVDGKVTKAKLNTFKEVQLFPDGEVQTRFVPEFEYAFKSVNSPTESAFVKYNGLSTDLSNYQEVLNYNMYNLRGEPLQITTYGTQKYTYLWGYNQNHPVAKIDNATYNETIALPGFNSAITGGLSDTQETTLRNGLPNAMITTYTYKPLFGVSTITDPKGDTTTFTYDNFGRLEFVKDNKGNILTENQYHYKP